jgi:PAS domain S-box-containing protein
MGYMRDDPRNRWNFFEVIPGTTRELFAGYIKKKMDGDNIVPLPLEARLVHTDGKVFDIIISAAILPGTNQSIISLLDITERKRAEEALIESESRFRSLAETNSAAILVFRQKILYANPAAEHLTGYSKDELCSMDFREFIHPEFRERVRDLGIKQQGGENIPFRDEFLIVKKNGTECWVEMSTTVVKIEGKPTSSISILIDSTERKVLEKEHEFYLSELERYTEILRRTNDKLNLMNNITRHDILNQLTRLRGCLEMMEKEFPDPALQKYFRHEIRSAKTIENLIRFTKDYQEIGVQSPGWFDLKKIILSAAETCAHSRVTVTVNFTGLELYADPLIEKVIYTLFDNALNHGKTVTKIDFSAVKHNDILTVIYNDNGVGVPAEHKEAIFQRKYFTHTGFGLFLSREILSITGSTIRETGEPGKGARFEITVPAGSFRM